MSYDITNHRENRAVCQQAGLRVKGDTHMERRYDKALVGAIESGARPLRRGKLELTLRPVPDDRREHVIDPRILEVSRRKMADARMSPSWTSLLGMRYRPDKPTYDLTSSDVSEREVLVDGGDRYIDLFIWTPERHVAPSPALVYLHGGAFMAGNVLQFRHQLSYIAEKSGAVVVYPEYRLAPETPFPGQIEDSLLAINYVRDNADSLGVNPRQIMVAGDSAGGSLTNACVQLLDRGTIAYAFEIYPEVDIAGDQGTGYDDFPVLDEQADAMRFRIDHLRDSDDAMVKLCIHGKTSPRDPLLSAVEIGDCSQFPPMTVITSEYDPLRIADERWVEKLIEAGVDVELIEYAGCDHGFFDHFGVYPQSEDVCLLMAERLKRLRETAAVGL